MCVLSCVCHAINNDAQVLQWTCLTTCAGPCAAGCTPEQLPALATAFLRLGHAPGSDWLSKYLDALEALEVIGLL